MLSACEAFVAEIIFAAWQTRPFCVLLFGGLFFCFTARASPVGIIRLLGREHDTKLKLMWENRIVCMHTCTSSEELILLVYLLGVDMFPLRAALQQWVHHHTTSQGPLWSSLLIGFCNFLFLPILPVLFAAERLKTKKKKREKICYCWISSQQYPGKSSIGCSTEEVPTRWCHLAVGTKTRRGVAAAKNDNLQCTNI